MNGHDTRPLPEATAGHGTMSAMDNGSEGGARSAREDGAAGDGGARRSVAGPPALSSIAAAGRIPEVLFVCVRNAGRSPMAAALLHHHAGDRVRIRSAGSDPADKVDPAVVRAMGELGIDLFHEFPKPLTGRVIRMADVVITMGCGDACPILPGKHYLDWPIDDPAGKDLPDVRRIRDEIDARVRQLIADLGLA